jgi:hypothetical protein
MAGKTHKSFRYNAKTTWSSARRGTFRQLEDQTSSWAARRRLRGAGQLVARRTARRLAQHMHDANFPHAGSSARADAGGL